MFEMCNEARRPYNQWLWGYLQYFHITRCSL